MIRPAVRAARECLCAECLRVLPGFFDSNEEAVCSHCGGELCDCADCKETIRLLRAGVRDAAQLGLFSDLLKWSAAGGGIGGERA